MADPSPGRIIRARQSDGTNSDILGNFRERFANAVSGTIQWHNQNITGLTEGRPIYKAYIYDPMNQGVGGGFVPEPPNGDFAPAREVGNIQNAFDGPSVELPNGGQVSQDLGGLVIGQTPFAQVDQSSPAAVMATQRADSVAGQVANFTSILSKVRMARIAVRLAVTNVGIQSRSWPVNFNGETIYQDQDLSPFTGWYNYSMRQDIAGIGNFAAPFYSIPPYVSALNTTIQDMLAGPNNAQVIAADKLNAVYDRMRALYEQARGIAVYAVIDYCHSSCHASCHGSRSRR